MNTQAIKSVRQNNGKVTKTLEGVLVNSHVKETQTEVNLDDVCDSLLISEQKPQKESYSKTKEESSFSFKKAATPLIIGTGTIFAGATALSAILKKGSKTLLNSKNFEQLPDLALNMNIKQEPQFVMYRMLRDPNFKNIAGASAVFLFSGLTLAAKNFADGIKEIWTKKQSADIERDLQENLIEVETSAFSGKLNEVNNMLNDSANYFKEILEEDNERPKAEIFFKRHFNFKGNKNSPEVQKEASNNNKNNLLFYTLAGLGVLFGVTATTKLTFSNLRKTFANAGDFANKYAEKTIEAIETISKKGSKDEIKIVKDLFQSISAKPEYIKETLEKMGADDKTIQDVIKSVEDSKKTLFADAPTALGGIPKKIQYYCYLDEDRGHLYNWITHPENKFAKYIFCSFASISAIGYIIKQGFEALKTVAVNRENSKTDLDLKQRLVEIEIANFKAKKKSAIQPLLDTFDQKVKEGKTKDELKQYAQNVLTEIKNGPPYVYS